MELRKSNYKNIVCPSLICLKVRHKLGKVFFSCVLPGRTEGNNGGQPNPRSFLGHQKNQNAVKFTNQLYLPLACRKYLSAPNVSPRNSALFFSKHFLFFCWDALQASLSSPFLMVPMYTHQRTTPYSYYSVFLIWAAGSWSDNLRYFPSYNIKSWSGCWELTWIVGGLMNDLIWN